MGSLAIGGVTITAPFMNAACSVAKTQTDVQALASTKAGIVLVGSITLDPRVGNEEPRWFAGDGFALNSFGMPNGGLKFYQKALPDMISTVHTANKKFALSVAGFNAQEYVELARLANTTKVDFLELNFGCPNVQLNGKQKPIVSFDPKSMGSMIKAVQAVTKIPLFIKVSPYSNPSDLKAIAEVLIKAKIAAVVTTNTFPNGYWPNSRGDSVLAVGLGGVSGAALLPISLGQVQQFRQILPAKIAVIGVGGIENKVDAKKYFQAGATMVQVATLIVRDGHAALDKLV